MPDESNTVTLRMWPKITIEQRPDRWVVKSDQLHCLVYGNSKEEATEAFRQAVESVVNSFTNKDDLDRYLKATEVQHMFEDQTYHQIEVAVGGRVA